MLLIPGLPLDGDAVHVLQVGAVLEDVVGGAVPVTEPDVLDGERLRVQYPRDDGQAVDGLADAALLAGFGACFRGGPS